MASVFGCFLGRFFSTFFVVFAVGDYDNCFAHLFAFGKTSIGQFDGRRNVGALEGDHIGVDIVEEEVRAGEVAGQRKNGISLSGKDIEADSIIVHSRYEVGNEQFASF